MDPNPYESPEVTPTRSGWPCWVRIGLWRLPSRSKAIAFVLFTVALAFGGVLYAYLANAPAFYPCIYLLAATAWYWLSIRWVDNHDSWSA